MLAGERIRDWLALLSWVGVEKGGAGTARDEAELDRRAFFFGCAGRLCALLCFLFG